MGSVVGGYQSEVSLDELPNKEDDHLICGCRPHFTMCGRYDPSNEIVIFKDPHPNDCEDCVKLWESRGCGACGCNSSWACPPCMQRYQRHLASTN